MSDWMPIETAPKDGTRILLWGDFSDGGQEAFVGYYGAQYEDERSGPYGPFVWRQWEGSAVAEQVPKFWAPIVPPR